MRIFGLKLGGRAVLSAVLVVSFVSGCVVEEKKRNRDDDCEDDSDCDDDEFCDDDNECSRRSSSGGSSGSSSNPSGGSSGRGGSSGSGPSGGTAGTGSVPSGSDTTWCTPRCEILATLCPENGTQAECISSCALAIAEARTFGCAAEYQSVIDCGATIGACDTDMLEAGCTPAIEDFAVCYSGSAG
jgi:hypothetical protein